MPSYSNHNMLAAHDIAEPAREQPRPRFSKTYTNQLRLGQCVCYPITKMREQLWMTFGDMPFTFLR